jgi:hypothetical protein
LVGPGEDVGTNYPTYTWAAVPGTTSYDFYTVVGTVQKTVNYSAVNVGCESGTGTCSVTPLLPQENGATVYWVVKAKNAAGASPWSTSMTFIVRGLPATPQLIGPTVAVATRTPSYSWNAVPGATEYTLFTDVGGIQATVTYSAAAGGCASGTGICTITPSTPQNFGTTVYWLTRARNIGGASSWSTSMNFTIMDPNTAPILISPSVAVATTTPTYTWNAVYGATDYDFYTLIAGAATTVTYTAANAHCASGTGTCNITPNTPLSPGSSVYWSVKAKNAGGKTPWSLPNTIAVMDPLIPPTLVGPAIAVSTTTPTYTWNAVYGATDYDIYTLVNGIGKTVSYTAGAAHCASGTGTCYATPAIAEQFGTSIYWVVKAKNSGGKTPWSSSMTFAIMNPAVQPTLVGPSVSVTTTSPTYTWNAVYGAEFYDFYTDIKGVQSTVSYSAADAHCASGIGTCYITPATPLTPGDMVYWLVKAKNVTGSTPWSTSNQFKVSIVPSTPTLVGPSMSVWTTTPLFSWNAVPDATDYDLYVVVGGSASIVSYSVAESGCESGSGICSVTLTNPLDIGDYVYWAIRAKNYGSKSSWSPALNFIVK